jgi:aminopeptidase N
MEIKDQHTFARPGQAIITHLDWQARVDFEQQTITGVAKFNFKKAADASQIILDISKLTINEVKDQAGNILSFDVGEEIPFMGQSLTINLNDNTETIIISYVTSPQAEALQWLNPGQTASGTMPFLFTQSQAILARSWIPIQDSPGIRFTYNAEVQVPAGMLALMSAENPREKTADGMYHFVMKQPIPAYLMALTAGDIVYKQLSERTGVYAEPTVIKAAAFEFAEMETMVVAAEALYGPYRWEIYDLIVLPPSFPFGGMENPRLTFATPTILAGDRSLTSLVAHELAHSWSGNLVTNATWDDFWLNEGFTVYFENRIMEAVYGRDYSEMLATLALQGLKTEIKDMTGKGQAADTHLKLNLAGRNPDDGMTAIAYDKGYYFLRLLEERVGRDLFDAFLKEYFNAHAFQVMTTEEFLLYLNDNLFKKNGLEPDEGLIQQWVYGPGLPDNCPTPVSDKFNQVDEVLSQWVSGTPISALISQEDIFTRKWSSHEWLHFLRQLPDDMTLDQMQELDSYLEFTYTGNSELLTAWLVHVIRHGYEPGYANLENFLVSAGRRKFLVPLYGEMAKTASGMTMAKAIYAKARPNYHYVSVATIDKMLNWQQENS